MVPVSPDEGPNESGSRMGFFGVLAGLVGALLLGAAGWMFLSTEGQSNIVAIVLFVLAVLLVLDAARRIWRISTDREHY